PQTVPDPGPQQPPPLSARPYRRREPRQRRARRLHPPRAHLVAGVYGGAPAIGEPAARLRARPSEHQIARPVNSRTLRPHGAVRGVDRDPQSHFGVTPRAPEQFRPLAPLREARGMDRARPRLPEGLLSEAAAFKVTSADRREH